MSENHNTSTAGDSDYRVSHLTRGSIYDATLSANFFDNHMAKYEAEYLTYAIPKLFRDAPVYLDFACGTGRITKTVAPFCARAIGVDVSPTMLDEARHKCANVEFVQADITKEALRCDPIDLITSFRFFGNAGDELRCSALRAINRLLRMDGCFIMNNHRNPLSIAALLRSLAGAKHDMDLTHFKLKRLLNSFGFRIIHQRPIGFWMYRSRLMASGNERDPRIQRLEARFSSRHLAAFAPDAIIVARKVFEV